VVEGCFNRFDTMVEVPMEPGTIVGLFNNVRCQAECGERGYALAATRSSPQACLCGNDYPTSFHQVGRCLGLCGLVDLREKMSKLTIGIEFYQNLNR